MRLQIAAFPVALTVLSCSASPAADSPDVINPTNLRAIGTIDKRFQAYNVEMVEVTGGRFWRPYKNLQAGSAAKQDTRGPVSTPAGMRADLYQYRAPIDLGNARLRKLAAALGPAYMRVSGTWANTAYFADAEGPAPKTPPEGFNAVLTREQWKGVIDFAHATRRLSHPSRRALEFGMRKAFGGRNKLARSCPTRNQQAGGSLQRSLSTNPICRSSAVRPRDTAPVIMREIWRSSGLS